MTRTALYRHFDAAGALLYVGISLSAVQRLGQHRDTAGWYSQIARVSIEWLPDRSAALAAEAIAIARENPKHNTQRTRVPISDLPMVAKPGAFGVLHSRTGRVDGWYRYQVIAEHMVGWFGAMFPKDAFVLATPTRRRSCIGRDVVKLNWLEWESWALTAPDYSAGDAFDGREAA